MTTTLESTDLVVIKAKKITLCRMSHQGSHAVVVPDLGGVGVAWIGRRGERGRRRGEGGGDT